MDDDLLTAQQVGKLLNIKSVTVYAAAADGRLPCVRLWKGRRRSLLRFRRPDIDRLIKEKLVILDRSDQDQNR